MSDLLPVTVVAVGHEDTHFTFDPWQKIASGHETQAVVGGAVVGTVRRIRTSRTPKVIWEFQSQEDLSVYSGSHLKLPLRAWIKDHS